MERDRELIGGLYDKGGDPTSGRCAARTSTPGREYRAARGQIRAERKEDEGARPDLPALRAGPCATRPASLLASPIGAGDRTRLAAAGRRRARRGAGRDAARAERRHGRTTRSAAARNRRSRRRRRRRRPIRPRAGSGRGGGGRPAARARGSPRPSGPRARSCAPTCRTASAAATRRGSLRERRPPPQRAGRHAPRLPETLHGGPLRTAVELMQVEAATDQRVTLLVMARAADVRTSVELHLARYASGWIVFGVEG